MELNLNFVELPELRLLVVKAETYPGGIPAAFERLESRLPSLRSRRLYGVGQSGPSGMDYYAGVVPEDEEEVARLGLPLLVVAAGSWAKAGLFEWQERRAEIGPMVDQIIDSVDFDPSRPVLEFYRSSLELHLLVPVGTE